MEDHEEKTVSTSVAELETATKAISTLAEVSFVSVVAYVV